MACGTSSSATCGLMITTSSYRRNESPLRAKQNDRREYCRARIAPNSSDLSIRSACPFRQLSAEGDARRREGPAELTDLRPHAAGDLLVVGGGDHFVHPGGELAHLRFLHAARGDGRRADADAAGAERLARVVGDGVVVADDAGTVERLRGLLPEDTLVRQVDQDQVIVGAAGDEPEAALQQLGGQRLRVAHDLAAVLPELL